MLSILVIHVHPTFIIERLISRDSLVQDQARHPGQDMRHGRGVENRYYFLNGYSPDITRVQEDKGSKIGELISFTKCLLNYNTDN